MKKNQGSTQKKEDENSAEEILKNIIRKKKTEKEALKKIIDAFEKKNKPKL